MWPSAASNCGVDSAAEDVLVGKGSTVRTRHRKEAGDRQTDLHISEQVALGQPLQVVLEQSLRLSLVQL